MPKKNKSSQGKKQNHEMLIVLLLLTVGAVILAVIFGLFQERSIVDDNLKASLNTADMCADATKLIDWIGPREDLWEKDLKRWERENEPDDLDDYPNLDSFKKYEGSYSACGYSTFRNTLVGDKLERARRAAIVRAARAARDKASEKMSADCANNLEFILPIPGIPAISSVCDAHEITSDDFTCPGGNSCSVNEDEDPTCKLQESSLRPRVVDLLNNQPFETQSPSNKNWTKVSICANFTGKCSCTQDCVLNPSESPSV